MVKIRELKVRDVRFFTGLLEKLSGDDNYAWLKTAIRPVETDDGEADTDTGAIISGFVRMLVAASRLFSDDFTVWFADLCGVTKDEYLDLPISTDLDVIEQIKTDPLVLDFFEKASAVFKLRGRFGGLLSSLKKTFGSVSA